MGQNSTNIDFASIVVNGSNQPHFVATDVEHSQPADLVSLGKTDRKSAKDA